MTAYNYNPNKLELTIRFKVNANSKVTKLAEIINIDDKDYIKFLVSSPAVNNQANNHIIDFLSKRFKIPKIDILITKGTFSNKKAVLIKNITFDYLKIILSDYINK